MFFRDSKAVYLRLSLSFWMLILLPTQGLARDTWKTNHLSGSPEPDRPYNLVQSYPELSFTNPVLITGNAIDGLLYVLEQKGKLYSFSESDQSVSETNLVIDLNDTLDAAAAYGFTFDPDFAENQYVYLTFIDGPNLEEGTRVARFQLSGGATPKIDPATEVEIIRWKSGGHNGGCLKFGPDGMLYISTGDAAPPSPPDGYNTGQGVDDLLSCILRLDVSKTSAENPYDIPQDNPFVEMDDARSEIYAFGFRNPWRMSFNAETGELWVGDVGWELWEMVFRVVSGGNYGWSVTEGPQPVRTDLKTGPGPVIPAVTAHHHSEARSITGGFVYRGIHQDLKGKYVYGDYVTGTLWALTNEGNEIVSQQEIVHSNIKVIAFGEDSKGELLVLDYAGGIYKLEGNPVQMDTSRFPRTISATGIFSEGTEPVSGVFEYSLAHPQWQDGATAEYAIGLPVEENVMLQRNGTMLYPEGTTLVKTLSISESGKKSDTRLETQVMFLENAQWKFYTYAWRDDQSDADLVQAQGRLRKIIVDDPLAVGGKRELEWRYHSRSECMTCHNSRATVLGFVLPQLNAYSGKPADQHRGQVHTLIDKGVIQLLNPVGGKENAHSVTGLMENLPEFHSPFSSDKEAAVKTYLAANCSHCHRPSAGGNATIDLQYQTLWENMKLINHRPTRGSFGIQDARIISAGDPTGSVLLYRLSTSGMGHMPHLGAKSPDAMAIDLFKRWIEELDVPQADELTVNVDPQLISSRASQSVSGALAIALDAYAMPTREKTLAAIRMDIDGTEPPLQLGLFQPFIDPSVLPQTLGTNVDLQRVLKLSGNATRGRILFLNTQGIQCKNCHQVGSEGKAVGPSVEDIAKRLDRHSVLESIVRPSEKIDAKYASYVIETVRGQVYSGIVKQRDAEKIVIVDVQGKQTIIQNDQLDFIERQDKSLMPDLQVKDLTAQQAADLVEFIKSSR